VADGPGWFTDPSGKINTFRWWDGQAWTRWLSADPATPDPGLVPAGPSTSSGHMRVAPDEATAFPPPDPGLVPAGPSTSSGHMRVAPDEATAHPPPDPADRVVGLPAAAAIIVSGILLAIIAVGAIISLTQDRPLSGPAVPPPPRSEAALAVRYDDASRAATVEELKVVLPSAPFACGSPQELAGLFDSAVSCGVTVHADYGKDKSDWGASAGIGLLEAERDSELALRELLASAASDVLKRNYEVDDITIKKAKNRPSAVAPAGRARVVTAELHVSYPGLPTEYDAMRVTVVRLAAGRHVVWWGLVPEDSPEAVRSAVAASAASLTAR
jgi:uncharacterized protein DUF2510